MESIQHAEGRITFQVDTDTGEENPLYEYYLKDHLGNVRVTLADKDGDGYIEPFTVNPTEPNSGGGDGAPVDLTNTDVLQETHYYPFGMTMEGEWQNIVNGPENNYLYNGKELNSDFGLDWSDYGARYYDAAIGRWNSVDPLTEARDWLSPYNYVQNNPLLRNDPTGALDNEYVVDSETGEYVQVGDKGGDDTDYIYKGKVTKNEKGEAVEVAYTTSNAKEVDVQHGSMMGGGEYNTVSRRPGSSTFHYMPNGAIHSVDDPFTMMGPSLLKWGVKGLSSALIFSKEAAKASPKLLPMLTETTVKNVLSSAQVIGKNGLSVVGRALQKHAGREGAFSGIKFSHKTGSQQGLDVLKRILNSKKPVVQPAGNGGYRIFDGATGRGFGLSRDGLFNGFREL